jgi:hypothetical protein
MGVSVVGCLKSNKPILQKIKLINKICKLPRIPAVGQRSGGGD